MTSLALLLLLPALASQTPGAPPQPAQRSEAVVLARVEFRKGNFREVLKLLEAAAAAGAVPDPAEQLESAQLQALSHVYLAEPAEAEKHFRELLLANPDYYLDPLVYGEDARNVVVATRMAPDMQPLLEKRREEIRQAKAREAEARKAAEEAETKRREIAAIPERVPIVVRHNALLNVLPFGVPQIEQDRITPGVLFAVAQGVTLTATVLTYTQVHSYIGSDGKVNPDDLNQAKAWRYANWVSVGAAAAVYLAGVVDAFVAHKEQTVKLVSREEYLKLRDEGQAVPALPPTTPVTPAPQEPQQPAPSYPKPTPTSFFLAPLPGGAAVGLGGTF